jgi:glycosyltransferase involved in cell wall biosynthesis
MVSLPTITVVIPTLNCGRILRRCLESVEVQNYPRERLQVLIVDGGSTDDTKEVATTLGAKILDRSEERENQEKRRGIGFVESESELVLFIDSDNILPHPNWIKEMVHPLLEDQEIVATQPARYHYDPSYSLMNRYFALFGFTDPVAGYLGKADRLSWVNDSWTLLGEVEERGRYYKVKFKPDAVPTIGANGNLIRREVLQKVTEDLDRFYHIDVNLDLIERGYDTYAFVKNDIIHMTSNTFFSYIRKRISYMRNYYFERYRERRYRIYSPRDRWRLIKYVISSVTFLGPFYKSLKGYAKIRDKAWFLHPFLSFAFTVAYGIATLEWTLGPLLKGIRRTVRRDSL